ncbi:MAG TPA: thioredoxin family protein [Chitinophagaceae bacterium]|nr:thioredoxin family protein [Chitinophagaceae bacterium]
MYFELEQDNLAEYLQQHENVLVQFSAGWCGNCKIMKPKFKKSETEHSDIAYVMVDAEEFPESRKLANVDNLPTFAAFKHGSLQAQVQTNKAEVFNQFVSDFLTP